MSFESDFSRPKGSRMTFSNYYAHPFPQGEARGSAYADAKKREPSWVMGGS